ncbi:hypothetical protein U4E84_09885 [Halorubrum sp. AD140]|uniref:hypothetical protein n=1 Tax=Halorubrum sp. AD140 TaxID=3050073 RepID=UPI002ACCDBAE|nr:hypothetical protein [Halorubrum sp. AD140]MDZ5811651.1 hypothetical protein [Halorubrum sp. AD140]
MIRSFIKIKPLQAGKFAGIILTLGLGIAGFLRPIPIDYSVGSPLLINTQFLALIGIPLLSLVLVGIVILETVIGAVRLLHSDRSIRSHATSNLGYSLARIIESSVALLGVALLVLGVGTLTSSSLPAPAGVGLLLGLMLVGIGVLVTSLLRTLVELYFHVRQRR